ncbi:MAG: transposase domain-containing protein [Burkholderiales bacterium]|nr:transposase domain-containing protein [Burkholderiales bacterium]
MVMDAEEEEAPARPFKWVAYGGPTKNRLNGVEPYAYLKDVLQRLPSHAIRRVAELLHFHWKPAAS